MTIISFSLQKEINVTSSKPLELHIGDHWKAIPYGYIESSGRAVITGCQNASNVGTPIQCTSDALFYIVGITKDMYDQQVDLSVEFTPNIPLASTGSLVRIINPFYLVDGSLLTPTEDYLYGISFNSLTVMDIPNGEYKATIKWQGHSQEIDFKVDF